jgi:hypothetical protein
VGSYVGTQVHNKQKTINNSPQRYCTQVVAWNRQYSHTHQFLRCLVHLFCDALHNKIFLFFRSISQGDVAFFVWRDINTHISFYYSFSLPLYFPTATFSHFLFPLLRLLPVSHYSSISTVSVAGSSAPKKPAK